MYYLGIDHHKRFSQVAVMDKKGKVHINCKMVNQKTSFDILKRRLNSNEPLRAVIEAGRNWGVMYDLLEEVGIDTTVAHPLKVRAIADAKGKNSHSGGETPFVCTNCGTLMNPKKTD